MTYCLGSLASIAIWAFPDPIAMPGWGRSFMADRDKLGVGKDIVFTSGPLGFLWLPSPVDHILWGSSISVFYCLPRQPRWASQLR